ncbi:hypothetical protein L218DRAFT_998918 [Marasmius fiardii PR-910]|nr:hypothetical protein L218DRAFT_998918 [Marasmius fiardii PR-910]
MTRISSSSSEGPGTDSLRRSRSHNPFLQSYRSEARASRSSLIPTALFRRLDITDDMSAQSKAPLLNITLSSLSFLDSTVQDEITSFPLYHIKTEATLTEVSRSDEWGTSFKAASIKWPKHAHKNKGKGKATEEVQVQLRSGRWKSADSFLSPPTVLYSPRKFHIPGYSHPLKWKAVGSSFWCVAASAKGPIAILEPAGDSVTPKLKIFETLHDKYDTRPMAVHRGVSLLLLDYVLVSALLLVTDSQEWTNLRNSEGESSSSPTDPRQSISGSSLSPRSASVASTSALQWRKILYGEPMFSKRISTVSQAPNTPTSARQMAKIMFGKPLYPSLRTSSEYSLSDFESDEESSDSEPERPEVEDPEQETEEEAVGVQVATSSRPPSRAPSPSAESVFYPLTTSSAPSHTYLDPLFYNEFNVPPVPKIPAQYATSANSSCLPSPIAPGLSSGHSRRFRELPRPPSSHRSQSTPRPRTADPSLSSPVESTVSSASDYRRPSYDATFLVSSPLRTLPLPPPTSPVDGPGPVHPPLRHSQSSGRPLNSRYRDKRPSQYANRTLPPTPTTDRHSPRFTHYPKRSFGDLAEWLSSTDWPGPHASTSHGRESLLGVVDCPPPAYNSIDFSQPTIPTGVASSTPAPPPPTSSPSETFS